MRAQATAGEALANRGAAADAIDFVLDGPGTVYAEAGIFLKNWREGDLEDWPEYYAWLASRRMERRA